MLRAITRRVGVHGAPRAVIAGALAASALAAVFGILQGWPLWVSVLAAMLPLFPLFFLEIGWTQRHYGWLAVFFVLVVTQTGHVGEHLTQMIQIHVFGLQGVQARGVFGALDVEWVHFVWNTWVLGATLVLLVHFRSNRWLWLSLVFAGWHELEHAILIADYIATGVDGAPGLLSRGGEIGGGLPVSRPDLHFFYNVVETAPIVVAFFVQVRRTYDEWLARAFPKLDRATLVELTDTSSTHAYKPGEVVVLEGDEATDAYVITKGEAEVIRGSDGGGRVATLEEGQLFGESGALSGGVRNASVRAVTPLEVLRLGRGDFLKMLDRSDATAGDIAEMVQARSRRSR